MSKTRRGIYYDLRETEYKATLEMSRYAITFYFSSLNHEQKFFEQYAGYITAGREKLSHKLLIDFDFDLLFAVQLYQKIETRGYHVEKDGKELLSLKVI